jgi:hypothetical protein
VVQIRRLIPLAVLASSVGLLAPAHGDGRSGFETSVAGVFLGKPAGGEEFLAKSGKGTLVDDGLINHLYSSNDGKQLLVLVRHPGSAGATVAQVTVIWSELCPFGGPRVQARDFRTGRGVRLGMKTAEVLRIYGKPTRAEKSEDGFFTTLVYECVEKTRCPALEQVNYPAYEGRYVFAGGALRAFTVGFPYP